MRKMHALHFEHKSATRCGALNRSFDDVKAFTLWTENETLVTCKRCIAQREKAEYERNHRIANAERAHIERAENHVLKMQAIENARVETEQQRNERIERAHHDAKRDADEYRRLLTERNAK